MLNHSLCLPHTSLCLIFKRLISHVLCGNAKCSTDLSIEIDTCCDATSHKTRQQKEPRIRWWLMQSQFKKMVLAESVRRNTRNFLMDEHRPSEQGGDDAWNRSKELGWLQSSNCLQDMSGHEADWILRVHMGLSQGGDIPKSHTLSQFVPLKRPCVSYWHSKEIQRRTAKMTAARTNGTFKGVRYRFFGHCPRGLSTRKRSHSS